MSKFSKKTERAIKTWSTNVRDGGASVSPSLEKWVEAKVVRHIAFASGHKAWCSVCGQSFATEKCKGKEVCPHCGSKLDIEKSRCAHKTEVCYVQELTTWASYQVVRTYVADVWRKKKVGTKVFVWHAYDWLIEESGAAYCFSRRITAFPYYRRIPFSLWDTPGVNPLSYKRNAHISDWNHGWVIEGHYPKRRFQPWLKKYDMAGKMMGLDMYFVIAELLKGDSHLETVWKLRDKVLCGAFLYDPYHAQRFWTQIKISLRHGFRVKDWKIWKDYLDLLISEGYDIFNPRYIAPSDLNTEHNRLVEEKQKRLEREEAERQRLKREAEIEKSRAIKDSNSPLNLEYRSSKGKLLSIVVKSGSIQIQPLQDIKDFYEEGKALHHCVYTNEYYAEPNSLILGARVDGKRTETIELNLRTLRIEQCRGKYNQDSHYHQEIYNLMQKSAYLYRFQTT